MAYRRPRQPTTILWKPAISEWGKILGTLSNQIDLQTALNAKVPYTGATANVDLGTHNFIAGDFIAIRHVTTNITGMFDVSTAGLTEDRVYILPNASGTLALTSFSRTFLLMGA